MSFAADAAEQNSRNASRFTSWPPHRATVKEFSNDSTSDGPGTITRSHDELEDHDDHEEFSAFIVVVIFVGVVIVVNRIVEFNGCMTECTPPAVPR